MHPHRENISFGERQRCSSWLGSCSLSIRFCTLVVFDSAHWSVSNIGIIVHELPSHISQTSTCSNSKMSDLVSIVHIPSIRGGSLGSDGSAWCPTIQIVDGIQFMKVSKRCSHLSKFCTGQGIGKESPLAPSTTIATLVTLRDIQWERLRNADGGGATKPLFGEELPAKRHRRAGLLDLCIVTIVAPSIIEDAEVVGSTNMKVLCEQTKGVLWMELTEGNLVYLRAGILASCKDGGNATKLRPKSEQVHSQQPGVRWDYRRSCWYMRWKDDTGQMKYTEFKVSGEPGSDEHVVARGEAEQKAIEFFQGTIQGEVRM
jgi:hypothetical protein